MRDDQVRTERKASYSFRCSEVLRTLSLGVSWVIVPALRKSQGRGMLSIGSIGKVCVRHLKTLRLR